MQKISSQVVVVFMSCKPKDVFYNHNVVEKHKFSFEFMYERKNKIKTKFLYTFNAMQH